jgi:DNA-binding transcriptional regulator YiaG
MQVITALPAGRLNGLMDQARRSLTREPSRPTQQDRPLAVEIREARTRARMSQVELAAALGIRQSSVSQWERAVTEPSTQNLLDLFGVLPGLAEALAAVTARRAPKDQPAPAGLHG